MLPMANLVLGILFLSVSAFFLWKGRMDSNSLISKWGNLKSKHITETDKKAIKNSGGILEMGFLGFLIGLFLLIEYFFSL
jgi:hypothetical protein